MCLLVYALVKVSGHFIFDVLLGQKDHLAVPFNLALCPSKFSGLSWLCSNSEAKADCNFIHIIAAQGRLSSACSPKMHTQWHACESCYVQDVSMFLVKLDTAQLVLDARVANVWLYCKPVMTVTVQHSICLSMPQMPNSAC